MQIVYTSDKVITPVDFIDLLTRSGLAMRRPVDSEECIKGMLQHADLTISAWSGTKLVGIARSVTDFHFACYLSDLAVDKEFQKQGVGKELQRLTQNSLGPLCKLILLAAPEADDYYAHVGYTRNPRCWVLEPNEHIDSTKSSYKD